MSQTTQVPGDTDPDVEAAGGDRFVVHRPPRRHPEPLPTGEVVIAPPPPRLQATGGWLVALLPALGSAGSLLLLGASGRRRWLLLAVAASLLLSLAAAAVPPLRRRRAGRRARDRYLDHLDAVAGTLARAAAVQRAAAGHLFPDLPGILAIAGGGERLWERRPADEDFLAVRVGRWTAPSAVSVRFDLGPDPLIERDPTLLAAARDLVRRASRLGALPLVVPLRRAGVVALTGPRGPARDLARFLLVQVAAFHAPGDVRILAAHPAADAGHWDWLKWLPHVRDRAAGPGTTAPQCLLASTAEQLGVHLEREVGPRLDRGARAGSGAIPLGHDPPTSAGPAHLLVVLDGFSPRGPLGRLAVLDQMLRRAADLEVTVLCLAGRRADEPSELRLRIELDGAGGIVLEETGPRGSVRRARGDAAGIRHCEAIARRLAPLRPAGQPAPGRVSPGAPVRLLELLGLDGPSALDPADAWRPRGRSGSLRGLAGLPHVGAVCGPGERDEARYLVRELRALLVARERASHGLTAGAAVGLGPPDRHVGEPDGHGGAQVLLLVDNWARLREELPDLEPEIETLAAAGLHHGVHLVVSANRWADLRLALRDNLGGRLELRLNDPLESAVGRAAATALPADTPGRGLTPTGLQFQAALPAISAATQEAGGATQEGGGARWFASAASEIVRHAIRSPSGAVAPPLRMLPAVVHAADLPDNADRPPGAIPLGLHEHQLAPVWLDLLSGPPHFLVLGDAACGKTSILRCLAAGLGALPPQRVRLTVIDYRRGLADLASLPHCGAYACTPAAAVAAVAGVHRAVERRSSPREPSAPRGWSGPHHVLLVDDYHLVTGAGSNLLEPLLDLVALGNDVGLHVVLACAAGGAARAAFDPFLRRLHEIGSPGLLMSGDPTDGPLLDGRPAVPLPPGRGLLIRRRGSAGRVQVVWVPPPLGLTGTTCSPIRATTPARATEATTLRSYPP
jgi:type VII secretion protein EccCb